MSRVNYQDDFTLSPVIDPVTKQTQQWKGIDSSVVTPKGAYGNQYSVIRIIRQKKLYFPVTFNFYTELNHSKYLAG